MSDQSLSNLTGRLLIQCRPKQLEDVAEVATLHGCGVVLTGCRPRLDVRAVRELGITGPVLCDANRYSGKRRVTASVGLTAAWVAEQHDAGLTALTDSGYLAADDVDGLQRILEDAVRLPPPIIVMLPLASGWFKDEDALNALIGHVDAANLPVAVAIEHSHDPFGTQYVVRGFLELLRVRVPLLLLRTDVSALGALCHGAHAAAIGTVTSLRHIFPVTAGGRPSSVAAFVTPLLGYHKLDTIEKVVAGTPDLEQLWPCGCVECNGHTPAALGADEFPQRAAFQHSLHAQLRLRDELLRPTHTRQALVSTWHEHCSHALFVHNQIAEFMPHWQTPSSLGSWFKMTRDPLGIRRAIPDQARTEQTQRFVVDRDFAQNHHANPDQPLP